MKILKASKYKCCDLCAFQESAHYCKLHSILIKNMDLKRCKDFKQNNPKEQG